MNSTVKHVKHGCQTRVIVTVEQTEGDTPRRNVSVEIGYTVPGGYSVSAYHYPDTAIHVAVDDARKRHPNGRITTVYEYE